MNVNESSILLFRSTFGEFGDWLYHWQTLISGLMAVAAAIWAGKLLRKQILQADNFYKNQLKQSHNATRVVLPLALSAINRMCNIATNRISRAHLAATTFDGAYHYSETEIVVQSRLKPLSLDREVIDEMKGFVETLRGAKSIRHVGELIGSIQILFVQFNELDLTKTPNVVSLGLADLMIYVAKIQLLTEAMYDYARFLDDKFAIVGRMPDQEVWDKVQGRVKSLLATHVGSDDLIELVETKVARKKKDNASPWLKKLET